MDDIAEVLQTISIGLVIANFLLNSSRVIKAIELFKECLIRLNNSACGKLGKTVIDSIAEVIQTISIGLVIANFLLNSSRVIKAIELCKECLIRLNNSACGKLAIGKNVVIFYYIVIYNTMLKGYSLIYDHNSAIECCRDFLIVLRRCGERDKEGQVTLQLAALYYNQRKYIEAKSFYEKALDIMVEIGDRKGEAFCYEGLGTVFESLYEYGKAKEYLREAIVITKEIGDKQGEALNYRKLGVLFKSIGENGKAEKYLQKALRIMIEIGDRREESWCYQDLAELLTLSLGEFGKAKEYLQKSLANNTELGDRQMEAADYCSLGTVFHSVGEYAKAQEYFRKALVINKEIGYRRGEAVGYSNLGIAFQTLGEYTKAEEYFEKALEIRNEVGDKEGAAADYERRGAALLLQGECGKAKKFVQKSLVIRKELGDKKGEAFCFSGLGLVFQNLGKFGKAEEYFQKALTITNEIGYRQGEAEVYLHLGNLFLSLCDNVKAEECLQKSLAIHKEIGHKVGEAKSSVNLATVFITLGDYAKAETCIQRGLAIRNKIGDRGAEAIDYIYLGILSEKLGEYGKAQKYFQKALTFSQEIRDRQGEASAYGMLGILFFNLSEYAKSREHHKKALSISREIGNIEYELASHVHLMRNLLREGNRAEAWSHLFASIEKSEDLRSFLSNSDQLKISFFERFVGFYRMLCGALCSVEMHDQALWTVELGRARALADLMSAQYSIENKMSVKAQAYVCIQRIMEKENNCTCLYISYLSHFIYLWIVKVNKPILFRRIDVNECFVDRGETIRRNVDEVFGKETFRRFRILPREHCEDRSLFLSNANHPTLKSSQEDVHLAAPRLVEIEEEEDEKKQLDLTLAQCHKMIIAPVADVLDGPEIIIVPDRCFYKVPFAALSDESGKPLSETFRIRIVPSLTTVKLIQDSAADYHSQTGALIVGEPKVSQVYYKGCVEKLCPLPAARKEAEMIGRLLGVQPLLGQEATKQAVLQRIHSEALIHFAAHGNAERGEIALAPLPSTNEIPQEDEYLLKMADISQVQLRAKLVVLSCCHSARGQITSEGVVGIARAFLGSGARSVLVALWALEDEATKHFMSRFYENLVHGESASESLHQAMKWMRSNGYSDVRQWAPFMLIGDNVSFDFAK